MDEIKIILAKEFTIKRVEQVRDIFIFCIFNHNIKRRVCIITEKEEELRLFILNDLHSGATIYESIGAYNMQKRNEIITIVDKSEYQKLMNYMSHEDPLAFITVYNVSDMRYQPKR